MHYCRVWRGDDIGPAGPIDVSMKGIRSTVKPSITDIAWAAGVYEGEGSCCKNSGSGQLSVGQKDPWVVFRLQELFGGSTRESTTPAGLPFYVWYVGGARGRGFAMTAWRFLSPRRKQQIIDTGTVDIAPGFDYLACIE